MQMPGWTGLANARVTIFGDTYQLPPEMQVWRICVDMGMICYVGMRAERVGSGELGVRLGWRGGVASGRVGWVPPCASLFGAWDLLRPPSAPLPCSISPFLPPPPPPT